VVKIKWEIPVAETLTHPACRLGPPSPALQQRALRLHIESGEGIPLPSARSVLPKSSLRALRGTRAEDRRAAVEILGLAARKDDDAPSVKGRRLRAS
jgi:hypothetical protein